MFSLLQISLYSTIRSSQHSSFSTIFNQFQCHSFACTALCLNPCYSLKHGGSTCFRFRLQKVLPVELRYHVTHNTALAWVDALTVTPAGGEVVLYGKHPRGFHVFTRPRDRGAGALRSRGVKAYCQHEGSVHMVALQYV